MKKYLMIIVMAMMAAISVNAQSDNYSKWSMKGRVGGNLATITDAEDTKMKLDVTAGFGVDYRISKNFALALEVNHDQFGAVDKKDDVDLMLDYFHIPLMAKFYATNWLAFEAGPQIGFLSKAKVDGHSNYAGIKVKDAFEKTEFSLPIGVSFEPNISSGNLGTLVVDLRYHLGLSKVNKVGDNSSRNSAIILTLGYKFGL